LINRRVITALVLLCIALTLGPAKGGNAQTDDEVYKGALVLACAAVGVELRGCPGLDSRLAQLIEASDPAAFAASTGLIYGDEGRVAVIIELADPNARPDADRYDLVVEASYANLVQAQAPLDGLCDLAADPAVTRVQPRLPVFFGVAPTT